MIMQIIDHDVKTFIEKELASMCSQVNFDARELLPKRSEKFVEKILKDSTGNLVKNESVHRIMHRFRRKAHKKGFNKILILGLFGHGKTEQMCIGLSLHLIAQNPDILIKIVHVSEDEAVNRVRAIRDYIDKDDDFKTLCPHIIPTVIWGSKKLIIQRKTFSKDPTVQANSILSAAIGGRATTLIFDDPQDLKTAVLEPTTRETIEKVFKNIWLSRLVSTENYKDAEIIVMMNKWHENDLANYIMNNPMWAWMRVGVNEDKESLFYEDSFGLERNLPLWTKFGKQELINRHMELGDRDYNRGYRLIPYTDKDMSFTNFENCCRYGMKVLSLVRNENDWFFTGGIDFSSQKRTGTTVVILATNKITGMKLPIGLYAFKGTTGLTDCIVETWKRFGVELFLAENNAVQDVIIDMLETTLGGDKLKRFGIKIEGHYTGKNKADPDVGLPSLQREMEKNEWMFCFDRQFTVDDNPEKNLWYRLFLEMKHHPFYTTSDFVMSLWFAREASKKFVRGGAGPNIW